MKWFQIQEGRRSLANKHNHNKNKNKNRIYALHKEKIGQPTLEVD